MLAMNPQNSWGCCWMSRGPGAMPWIINAAIMMAGMAPEGSPRASMGTKAPDVAELLADSGPATPATAPWPNSSGCFDTRFSTA